MARWRTSRSTPTSAPEQRRDRGGRRVRGHLRWPRGRHLHPPLHELGHRGHVGRRRLPPTSSVTPATASPRLPQRAVATTTRSPVLLQQGLQRTAGWPRSRYTYSSLRGNYNGLFRPETGQLDPNINARLRPHLAVAPTARVRSTPTAPTSSRPTARKEFQITNGFGLAAGLSYRRPLGYAHQLPRRPPDYGSDEVFVLPRGAGGRCPGSTHQLQRRRALQASARTTCCRLTVPTCSTCSTSRGHRRRPVLHVRVNLPGEGRYRKQICRARATRATSSSTRATATRTSTLQPRSS